jgi:hypothetical protein
MGGGDAVSIQEARRKTHRGRKEEGGETVKAGAVRGGGMRCVHGSGAILMLLCGVGGEGFQPFSIPPSARPAFVCRH